MSDETVQEKAASPRTRSRLRRFLLRHVPLAGASGAVLLVLVLLGLYFYASSDSFQDVVRQRLAREIADATGGRVEIAAFRWKLLRLEAEADGLIIHGRESANEAPYARIDHLRAQVSILGILSPNVRLSDLDVQRPAIHLITYADGTTNQPQPRRKSTSNGSAIDRLFDMQVGHVAVENGFIDYDNRAATYDFQSRRVPLDFAANDLTVKLNYVAAAAKAPEKYIINFGATDLTLVRGTREKREPEVHGRMRGELDLTRSAARLRQLTLTDTHGKTGHSLAVNGVLENFSQPRWQATIQGDLDMRLLEPALGYPFAPEGIARLDLTAKGNQSDFAIDGRLHVDGGAYIGPGVNAHGITLDTRVHADYDRLLIDQTVVQFKQGGEMTGVVDLHHWRPPREPVRIAASPTASTRNGTRPQTANRAPIIVKAPDDTIPVDGKVTAELKNLALDTVLEIVSVPPFQHVGISALLNGPAEANWSKGDNDTVVVRTNLLMSPQSLAGEVPATGVVDATYTNKNGAVDIRDFEMVMPGSDLHANGRLGAYPMTSPTALTVTLHSQKLEEFDTVLRELRLEHAGRVGAAALPAKLAGQADFSGSWNGTLLEPRIAGNAKATQVEMEMPGSKAAAARYIHFDAIDAAGSYSAERISIDHATLTHGAAKLAMNGTLDATAVPVPGARHAQTQLTYDASSMLHARLQATDLGMDDLQMFVSGPIPATGNLNASLEAHGPLKSLEGSGSLTVADGSLYGQPFSRARAQGVLAGTTLKLNDVNATAAGGSVTGSGSYDFAARRFDVNGHASGCEISQLKWVQQQGTSAAGTLDMNVKGGGPLDDPQLQGTATIRGLTIGGDPLGSLNATAHTADHAAFYDVTTMLAGAQLNLHGKTDLRGDNLTEDRLEFTRFDVGALLKLAHVNGISGESDLAGTMTLAGPLRRLEALRGEARLQRLAVTLSGVHLASEGGVHATLANGRVQLDPLHITGESTDVHVLGTVALHNDHRMDLAASGTINMKLAETLDPDLTASGTTTFEVESHGTVQNPGLRGRIDVQNGAISMEDLPNGLSQMKGTLEFNQNRLEVRNLTAMTGGGLLTLGGSLTYQHGLFADLTVTGKGVRIRYPQGVSSLADASLRLQGQSQNLLLSGDVMITRFATSPDLDLAALAAQANSKVQAVVLPNAPSNHLRLDVHLVSSPQLNFQNAFAKLAGDIDVRVRGTLAAPSVLGSVSITEGSAVIAGTRYDLERGDIDFTNPVRIEPVIDVTATAHVEDYDITLGLHGTIQKMSVSYRSDPPLPESDVVSLLALGHTQDQQRLYTQQQEQEFSGPSTDALLGGALNATVSSRMQKLFGAGSVKVDPDYLGAFGNSTSRVTVQEQVGRNLTLTYATDVNTTGQQLLQAEVAINRHVSLVVARDEAGVFSMVLKNTRRYK